MMQKFKLVERMMQSNKIIASLFSNGFEHVTMMQSKQIIASSPLTMLSKQIFPFQKMMQSKQVIASSYCITIFKQS